MRASTARTVATASTGRDAADPPPCTTSPRKAIRGASRVAPASATVMAPADSSALRSGRATSARTLSACVSLVT